MSSSMPSEQDGWERHAEYLYENTPLSKKQASVLALRKSGRTPTEVGEALDITTDTVNTHWERIFDKLDAAKEFRVLMGPHPWGDLNEWDDEWDRTAWEKQASASFERERAPTRTRVELEVFRGGWNVNSHEWLLVERVTTEPQSFATETTETRSCHGVNGLRSYIYQNASTLREYYIRWHLLAHSGIDPGADAARRASTIFGREFTEEEKTEASTQAEALITTD